MTWTSFGSEEEFNQWLLETGITDEVVAAGVSQDDAINFVRNAPVLPQIGLAFQEASQHGEFNEGILGMKLRTLAMLRRWFPSDHSEQDEELFGGFPLLGE